MKERMGSRWRKLRHQMLLCIGMVILLGSIASGKASAANVISGVARYDIVAKMVEYYTPQEEDLPIEIVGKGEYYDPNAVKHTKIDEDLQERAMYIALEFAAGNAQKIGWCMNGSVNGKSYTNVLKGCVASSVPSGSSTDEAASWLLMQMYMGSADDLRSPCGIGIVEVENGNSCMIYGVLIASDWSKFDIASMYPAKTISHVSGIEPGLEGSSSGGASVSGGASGGGSPSGSGNSSGGSSSGNSSSSGNGSSSGANLSAAKGVTAKASGMNQVSLGWKAVSGADGYLIIGLNNERKGTQIGYTTGKTSWVDTKADAAGWNYYWIVPYKKVDGKTVKGQISDYTYALGRTVEKVSKVTAVSTKAGIKLTWPQAAGANAYVIMSKTGSPAASFNKPVVVKGTGYIDTRMPAGQIGYYWVYGVYNNAAGKPLATGQISPFAWAVAK